MTNPALRTSDAELSSAVAVSTPSAGVPSGDPAREIRLGLVIAGLFFVLFLGWASFARLDAAVRVPARLAVTGQLQTIQHREGGVVERIFVKEGSYVQSGQLLIQLAGGDVLAQERSLTAQAIGLYAQRARLLAAQAGKRTMTAPPEFAALPLEDRKAAAEALQIQQKQLETQLAVLEAQRGAIGKRASQAGSQGQGYSRQVAAINEQIRIIDQELSGMREIAEKGFVSKNRIRDLERVRADLAGQRGQYEATIEQSRGMAGESSLQALEAQNNYFDRIATELRQVEDALNDVTPKLSAAREQLARTQVRAPVSGSVVGLTVFVPGAVIQPGQKVMDIVPSGAGLTVQGSVSNVEGDNIRVGDVAYVRFESLHDRSAPVLKGKVVRVSADAFTDEKTGGSYYTAEIAVPKSELAKIERLQEHPVMRPGIPVSVTIPLRKRTALQYAFEPLTSALRGSFSEQ